MLKTLREKKGLTQAQLADTTGVTRKYITLLETGAKALGVPVIELPE